LGWWGLDKNFAANSGVRAGKLLVAGVLRRLELGDRERRGKTGNSKSNGNCNGAHAKVAKGAKFRRGEQATARATALTRSSQRERSFAEENRQQT
jgi:hypothetical protein